MRGAAAELPNQAQTRSVSLVAIVALLYVWIFGRVLWRVGDEGTIVHGAHRVAHGEVPYRDFFEVMGPGSFYWLAAWFRLFGESWIALRLHLILTAALTVVLIYGLTRCVYRGRFDALPCVLFMVVGFPSWPASSHHWDATLFSLATIAGFMRWVDTRRLRWLVLTGILAGATTCVIQQKGGLVFLAATGLVVSLQWNAGFRSVMRSAVRLVVPYAIVVGAVIMYFSRAGALVKLFEATMLWPVTRYREVNRLPYGFNAVILPLSHVAPALTHAPSWLASLLVAMSVVPFMILVLLPVLTSMVAIGSHKRLLADSRLWPHWVFGVALFASELQRPDIFHLIWGSPLLVIAVFVGATRLVTSRQQVWIFSTISLCVFVYGGADALVAATARELVRTPRGTVRLSSPDYALQFVIDRVKPGSALFVYPYYPMYYYLANVRNPTRYSIFVYNMNTADQFNEAVAALRREDVEYILWDTVVSAENMTQWFPAYVVPDEDQRVLERYITDEYEIVGTANGFRILRRRR